MSEFLFNFKSIVGKINKFVNGKNLGKGLREPVCPLIIINLCQDSTNFSHLYLGGMRIVNKGCGPIS
jgi:hypothetical protein